MSEDRLATFRPLLRRARLAAGLTQEALAERTGLGARTIQEIERGTRQPRRETIDRVVRGLSLTGDERRHLSQPWPLHPANADRGCRNRRQSPP